MRRWKTKDTAEVPAKISSWVFGSGPLCARFDQPFASRGPPYSLGPLVIRFIPLFSFPPPCPPLSGGGGRGGIRVLLCCVSSALVVSTSHSLS